MKLYVISLMLEVYCSSSVYVEGDIETRVYNDGINGEVKNIPEICIRHDGIKPTITVFFFSLNVCLVNCISSFCSIWIDLCFSHILLLQFHLHSNILLQ